MNDFSAPVVLIVFNRPELTQQALDAISKVKPRQLYVIADGPRTTYPNDIEKCQATRAVVDTIDWECRVSKNYADQNLGCQQRISSGLDWVFEQVEFAIILEDDCLPNPSFFRFCDELLIRYEDDKRIAAISGNNFQFGRNNTEDSYYFSRYPHCWGWATWKRAWQYYDVDMQLWPQAKRENRLKDIFYDGISIRYWQDRFQKTYDGNIDTWDYAWFLACWLQNGLCILPKANLVSNIGFTAEGTHCISESSLFSNMPTAEMMFPLEHPAIILRNDQADKFTQFHTFGLSFRLYRKVKAVFKYWIKKSRSYTTTLKNIYLVSHEESTSRDS